MTDLSGLYLDTLQTLDAIKRRLLSPEWQEMLAGASLAERLAASQEMMTTQQAILRLSDASLSAIADKMDAQRVPLTEAVEAANNALAALQTVQAVVGTVAQLIGEVAKVVPFV